MIPKQNMINLVFDEKGKVKLKCEADAIPTSVVEEIINSAINAYESAMIPKTDKDEIIKNLKRWNLVLSIALVIVTILNLVR